jgi:hypothetical protein
MGSDVVLMHLAPISGSRSHLVAQVAHCHIFQEHLRKLFLSFREASLKPNPENCQLFQKEVRYIRHVVSHERITTDPDMLRAIREWPTLKNKHEIQSFLGLFTYNIRFISGCANVTKPLTKLLTEKQAPQWTQEVETAFQTLKEAFCTARILAQPPVDTRSVDCLPYTKGSFLYLPYSCSPAAKRDVRR